MRLLGNETPSWPRAARTFAAALLAAIPLATRLDAQESAPTVATATPHDLAAQAAEPAAQPTPAAVDAAAGEGEPEQGVPAGETHAVPAEAVAAPAHGEAAEGHGEPDGGPYGHVCLGEHCELLRVGALPHKFDLIEHVSDGKTLEFPLLPFLGHVHLPRGFTKVSAWMLIAALFLIGIFALARSGMGLVPKGLYNLLETFVVFVRDEIAVKNMGAHHAREYTPYLLTVFFFILTCNLLGLLPGGVTVTGNINVTATLALMTLFMTQMGGIKQYGLIHHFKNLVPPGIPAWLMPIMIVVELMGVLAKPFALAVRLFANMTAGHVIILSLLGLIFSFGLFFSPVSIAFSLFIFLLELLVAFLQAFIFTMLTALFIGMSVHVSH